MNTSEQVDDVWGEMDPTQRLCLAVLQNAIDAMLGRGLPGKRSHRNYSARAEQIAAANFIFNPMPNADIRYWCEGAGVSRAWFVEQVRHRKQKLLDRKERLSRKASAAYTQRASEA